MLKIEAIELLIGRLILSNRSDEWDYVNENIKSAMAFYPHEEIFHAMRSLKAKNKPLDIVLVMDEIAPGDFDDVISMMVKKASGQENIRELVNIMLDTEYHDRPEAGAL